MTRRARFTVAYDGTAFHGFAEQVNARTVMGELRVAIEKIGVGIPSATSGAVGSVPTEAHCANF